ncbi:MAG: hypothetical protein JO234_11115, partial [Hyphomicrobiales bacterium]|nr:hypothetical protein [Hyphomicrobiales bacterium]
MSLRIGQKLGLVIGLLTLLPAGLATFAVWQSQLQQQETERGESVWDFALQARGL